MLVSNWRFFCFLPSVLSYMLSFSFHSERQMCAFFYKFCGMVDREGLGSTPALLLCCPVAVRDPRKNFTKIQRPAIVQQSQEITPCKRRCLYYIQLFTVLPDFRTSHCLWACHCCACGTTSRGQEGCRESILDGQHLLSSNPETFI